MSNLQENQKSSEKKMSIQCMIELEVVLSTALFNAAPSHYGVGPLKHVFIIPRTYGKSQYAKTKLTITLPQRKEVEVLQYLFKDEYSKLGILKRELFWEVTFPTDGGKFGQPEFNPYLAKLPLRIQSSQTPDPVADPKNRSNTNKNVRRRMIIKISEEKNPGIDINKTLTEGLIAIFQPLGYTVEVVGQQEFATTWLFINLKWTALCGPLFYTELL